MARAKGTAAQMEDWLFAQPGRADAAAVRDAAQDVGGITDFDASTRDALKEVKNDAGLGGLLGVDSTPTFFINGRNCRPAWSIPPTTRRADRPGAAAREVS